MERQLSIRPAVTLIEVLVVIGVFGVLISLILPAVQDARDAATRTKCANNLRQLALGVHGYEATYQYLPPRPNHMGNLAPERLLNWHSLILPYIEQTSLWDSAVIACASGVLPITAPPHAGYITPVLTFICPADSRLTVTLSTPSGDHAAFGSYLGVSGSMNKMTYLNGVLGIGKSITFQSVTDGTSTTLMIGERTPPDSLQAGRWYTRYFILEHYGGPDGTMSIPHPKSIGDYQCRLAGSQFGPGRTDNPCDRMHYWSLHRGGANFAFVDGSVRFLRYDAHAIMPALATRAGGEIVSLE